MYWVIRSPDVSAVERNLWKLSSKPPISLAKLTRSLVFHVLLCGCSEYRSKKASISSLMGEFFSLVLLIIVGLDILMSLFTTMVVFDNMYISGIN